MVINLYYLFMCIFRMALITIYIWRKLIVLLRNFINHTYLYVGILMQIYCQIPGLVDNYQHSLIIGVWKYLTRFLIQKACTLFIVRHTIVAHGWISL